MHRTIASASRKSWRCAALAVVAMFFVTLPADTTKAQPPPVNVVVAQAPVSAPVVTPGAVDSRSPSNNSLIYGPALPADLPVLTTPVAPSPAAVGFQIPKRPQEARAAKAYVVFETHCARCHQTGMTERPLPSGGITNILNVDTLMRDPVLVRPGLPDASKLYDVMATRHAPLDVYPQTPVTREPRPEEIQAVREWIADLGLGVQACHARAPMTTETIEALVAEAQALERDGASDLRFISLAQLYNACATPDEMVAFRQALTKVLNGVSWSPEPVALTPLDPGESLFVIRLADLGWVAADWETLLRSAPQWLNPPLPPDIIAKAGTSTPIVPGDWLTAAVSDTPLYYALLRLPPTLTELARLNGVDVDQNIRTGSARRAATRTSAVTRGNRLSERHPGSLGGFWLIYDFATSSDEQDLFAYPLGPKRTPSVRTPFKPDQVRAMFPLPNGFFATALFDAAGTRIERAIPGVETSYSGDDITSVEPGTTAGARCFSCHVEGIIGVKDVFRGYAEAPTARIASDIKAAALPLFSSDSEMSLLVGGDNERYRNAMLAAGIEPSLRINGEELTNALANRYRGAKAFDGALAETGLARDAFLAMLTTVQGPVAPLARRLQHGALQRTELNHLFAAIKGIDQPGIPTPTGGFLRDEKSEIGLSMWLDKPRPVKDDLVDIKIETDTDCFLTVVSVNDEGQATVLFPNDFEPDNQLEARKAVAIPGLNAPYQLRLKASSAETLLARCTVAPDPPSGIEHDFERQKFTVLGNWENFIRDTIETEADLRANPQKVVQAQTARAEAQRRRSTGRQRANDAPPMRLPERVLRDGRAVLVVGGG